MNRSVLFACLPLVAAVIGCGPKPAPIIEARPIEKPKVDDGELRAPAKPTASDPDARKLLDDMLAAHTGGKPEKLAALKDCTFTRKGIQEGLNGRFPAVWTRHLSWPNGYRLRVDLELGGGATQQIVFATGPAGAWRVLRGEKEKTPLDADGRGDLNAQQNEDALALLFPLADPAVVVSRADGKDVSVTDLNAWVPAIGYVRLGVDSKTKLLARLTCGSRENGVPVQKEVTFQEFKEFAGVQLGTKVQVRTKAKTLGEWDDLTVEATKPDPKLFEAP